MRWASTQNMVMMKVNYRTVCLQKPRPQGGLSLNKKAGSLVGLVGERKIRLMKVKERL